MASKQIQILLTAVIAAFSISAQAGVVTTINTNGAAVADAAKSENFDNGTTGSNVTDQFAANGLTFKTLGDAGIALTSNNVCNNASGGMSGKYLSMGMRYPCTGNTAYNAVSMTFDGDVSELSWLGFNRTIGNGFTVQVLNNGAVVADTIFGMQNRFDKQTIRISGLFDEIRFIESNGWQGFFGMDNMAWKMAPAAEAPPVSDVPEPGIALLFGAGMIGLGFMRRKYKAA